MVKAWWGHANGDELVVVTANATKAAKMVGLTPLEFRFKFEKTAINSGMQPNCVYVKVGTEWVQSALNDK